MAEKADSNSNRGNLSLRNENEDEASSIAALSKLLMGFQVSQAIYVAAELKLAGLLKDQPRSLDELAGLTRTNPTTLYRLMRVLATVGIFEETSPKLFALTNLGRPLQEGVPGSLHSTALFHGSPRQWQTWHHLLYSVQTGESASKHVFGVSTWEYYAQHPEEAKIFYGFSSESSDLLAPALTLNYDFKAVKSLADVGGGFGYLLSTVLKAHSHLKGVLFDLPHVSEGARQALDMAGVLPRTEIFSGDIFSPWPFKADLYILSRVIHDWKDHEVITILKNCREVMGPEGKVLVIERIIPEDKEKALPILLSDLQMLISAGGQERTLSQYQELFKAARLKFTRTIPLYHPWNIIEAERSS